MASLPRLPTPAEHRLLKAACGLSPRVSRRLFGPPPSIDGQTLASDIHAMLRLAEFAGSGSFMHNNSVERAREEIRRGTAAAAGRPLPMAEVREMRVAGGAGEIPARLYVPSGLPPEPAPLLVFFHGGGWVIGDLDTHDSVCRFLAAHAGVKVLAVDYRLAPEHPFPAAVEDAWASFAWAVEKAAELGVDPARIAVGGDSAGGNLAAGVSLEARGGAFPAPALQMLFYPVTDAHGKERSRSLFSEGFLLTKGDMDAFESIYLPNGTDPNERRVSILQVEDLSGLAPAFVITAGFDPLRDEGEAYALRMREAGVAVAVRRYSDQIHGFANETAISRSARAAMLEIAGALRMGLASAAA